MNQELKDNEDEPPMNCEECGKGLFNTKDSQFCMICCLYFCEGRCFGSHYGRHIRKITED